MALPNARERQASLSHANHEGWWFRAKEDIVRDFLRSHVSGRASVLVLGCGAGGTIGRVRQLAPECPIVGLDLDPEAVAVCASRDPGGTYRVADLEGDELAAPESMDLVIALEVLEHLKDDVGIVRRVAKVLKPGAVLVVSVPAHPWLFSQHDVHVGHLRRYRPAEIEALLLGQGLHVVHATPLFMTTLLVLAVWRQLIQRHLRVREHESDVGVLAPRWVDAALYGLARGEGLIARYRLPFGSSHLVIAKKPQRV